MKIKSRSAVLALVPVAAVLAIVSAGNGAQSPNKCLAGKEGCASKKMAGLLKCHSKAESSGAALDASCTQKVTDKFDGGAVPANGCFAKLESKNQGPCITTGDTSTMETKIDSFVSDVVQTLDPGFPTPVKNPCSASKKKCVAKKAAALLKCYQKAAKAGVAVDGTCLQKAQDKFDGGAMPANGCFAKLEAKPGCLTTNDTAALETKVDTFVGDVTDQLNPPTPTPTPTPTVTPTCLPPPTFAGALVPTVGRFNYNLVLGLPGANAACNSNYPGTQVCTLFQLQCAQAAGELVGATDTSAQPVNSFWAIDPNAPPLQQCLDDAVGGTNQVWEYGTAHTATRGNKIPLQSNCVGGANDTHPCTAASVCPGGSCTSTSGTLGSLSIGNQCNFSGNSNVGCCH
jgi:hypothetical protein